jgi:hypothetical protein
MLKMVQSAGPFLVEQKLIQQLKRPPSFFSASKLRKLQRIGKRCSIKKRHALRESNMAIGNY